MKKFPSILNEWAPWWSSLSAPWNTSLVDDLNVFIIMEFSFLVSLKGFSIDFKRSKFLNLWGTNYLDTSTKVLLGPRTFYSAPWLSLKFCMILIVLRHFSLLSSCLTDALLSLSLYFSQSVLPSFYAKWSKRAGKRAFPKILSISFYFYPESSLSKVSSSDPADDSFILWYFSPSFTNFLFFILWGLF